MEAAAGCLTTPTRQKPWRETPTVRLHRPCARYLHAEEQLFGLQERDCCCQQAPPPPLLPLLPAHHLASAAALSAAHNPVTRDEVLALRELYTKLSNELHQDNLIHKDEFMWALFKANRDNLFAERVRWFGIDGDSHRWVDAGRQAQVLASLQVAPAL